MALVYLSSYVFFHITVISDQAGWNDEPQMYHAHPNSELLKMCYTILLYNLQPSCFEVWYSMRIYDWIKLIIIENILYTKDDI